MKNKNNQKVEHQEVIDAVINEEKETEANEEFKEPTFTVELTQSKLDRLNEILAEEPKKIGVWHKIGNVLKPTKKKVAIVGSVIGGVALVAGGIAVGKGKNSSEPEVVPELPDNGGENFDDYNEDVQVTEEVEPEVIYNDEEM